MDREGSGEPQGGAPVNRDGATWARRTAAREAVPPAVDCQGLGYRFGDVAALDDVTFTITPGEVFGLLGPNGAGKTTTIRILTTLLKPATGSARVFGLDTVRARMRVRQAIGYVPQQLSVDASLTGWENVWLFARLFDVPRGERKARIDQALELMELVGEPNVGVHLDAYHMNIEEDDFRGPVERAAPSLVHFHLSESHRGIPGRGTVDWEAIMGALKSAGYDGYVGLESFVEVSNAMRGATCSWRDLAPSSDELVREGLAYLKSL